MSAGIFLSLGSNIGNKGANLDKAVKAISSIGDLVTKSSIYSTEPWGKTNQPSFYNQVIQISTLLEPDDLLNGILSIEASLGRVREEKWGPRVIDIDILIYGERIVQRENLTIPHSGIPFRKFVLAPLAEIAPLLVHPSLKKSITALLKECADMLEVERVLF